MSDKTLMTIDEQWSGTLKLRSGANPIKGRVVQVPVEMLADYEELNSRWLTMQRNIAELPTALHSSVTETSHWHG